MDYNRITIHQIKKQQGIAHTDLITSNQLITIDDNVKTLVEKLNEAFKKEEKVIRTEFLEAQRAFQRTLKAYNREKNDETFFTFSESSINRINDLLKGANLATGGYFVYADYVYRQKQYVSVFLVRDTEEIIFDRKDGENIFTVNKTTVINTRNLAMAVRVDLDQIITDGDRYVHFTFKQSDISEYFVDWIEIHLSDKSKEDTVTLLGLINSVDPYPIDPETNQPFEREKFRNQVHDYIQSSGRVVKLGDISNTFWDDRQFLSNLAEQQGIDINLEFRADPSTLSRLKKYRLISGKMSLSYSQSDVEQGRIFGGEPNQIVLENAALRNKFDLLNG